MFYPLNNLKKPAFIVTYLLLRKPCITMEDWMGYIQKEKIKSSQPQ